MTTAATELPCLQPRGRGAGEGQLGVSQHGNRPTLGCGVTWGGWLGGDLVGMSPPRGAAVNRSGREGKGSPRLKEATLLNETN